MRDVRLVLAALALIVGAGLAVVSARAAAPQVKKEAPGFYRLMLGDFEITALSDGVFDLDTRTMLADIAPERREALLKNAFETDVLPTSVNAYLINTGESLVLVDTGAADRFGPTLGHLLDNLIASGYRPEQVDRVLVTHLHPDHIGGLVADGRRVFPNATVHVERKEMNFWLSAAALEAAPEDRKAFFRGAAMSIDPYARAGRLEPFSGTTELSSGITAVSSPGHTPGHTTYVIESKGRKLVLWGDLMEVAAIHFVEPATTIAFDVDGREAVARRPKAYADAAAGRHLVGASHLPFPGIGHLRAEPEGYAWVPVAYDTVR